MSLTVLGKLSKTSNMNMCKQGRENTRKLLISLSMRGSVYGFGEKARTLVFTYQYTATRPAKVLKSNPESCPANDM